jgi:hypothetical protein
MYAHAGAEDFTAVAVVGAAACAYVAVRRARAGRRWWLSAVGMVALLALAVGTRNVRSTVSQARVRPRSTATIAIVEPVDGARTASTVRVRVRLTGGHLVAATSTRLAPDQGHVHIRLDGRTGSSLARLDVVLHHVNPGRHVLEAEYVALDHGPFSPRVLALVTISVP